MITFKIECFAQMFQSDSVYQHTYPIKRNQNVSLGCIFQIRTHSLVNDHMYLIIILECCDGVWVVGMAGTHSTGNRFDQLLVIIIKELRCLLKKNVCSLERNYQ